MKFEIERDDERRQLIVTLSGVVTLDDDGEVTAYSIRDLAATARVRAPLGRTAIAIVTTSEALHRLARMYASLIEGSGYRVEVFADRESATRWLDDNTS